MGSSTYTLFFVFKLEKEQLLVLLISQTDGGLYTYIYGEWTYAGIICYTRVLAYVQLYLGTQVQNINRLTRIGVGISQPHLLSSRQHTWVYLCRRGARLKYHIALKCNLYSLTPLSLFYLSHSFCYSALLVHIRDDAAQHSLPTTTTPWPLSGGLRGSEWCGRWSCC